MTKIPTPGFVAGWSSAGILLTVLGTRWPYIIATAVLIAALLYRQHQLKREIARVLNGEDPDR